MRSMTDKQALEIALKALNLAKKPLVCNANLYRIYGDKGFISWHDKLTEIEQTEEVIHNMMEIYSQRGEK
jgi:hypothetical protein